MALVYEPDNEVLTGTLPDVAGRAVSNTIQEKAERLLTADIKKEVGSGIPDPLADTESLYRTVRELKIRFEQLTRTRGDRGKSAVMVEELSDLFEVAIRELDSRYSKVPLDNPEVADPDTGEVTLADLSRLTKALNAHTGNTDLHYSDAPEQYVWVRNAGEWFRGMTYDDIVAYVAQEIAANAPADGLQQVSDDLAPALGGDLAIDGYGFTTVQVADEDLSRGDLCYMTASGTMAKASASQSSTCKSLLGIAMGSLEATYSGKFLIKGFFTGLAGLTPGDVLYVSTTTGTWQSLRPFGVGDVIRPIGYSAGADRVFFDPDKTWTTLEAPP